MTTESLFVGTSSYATTAELALSASHAAEVAYGNVSGITAASSFAGTASYATEAGASATAVTSSYVAWANVDESSTDQFLGTASYASLAKTASYIDGGTF